MAITLGIDAGNDKVKVFGYKGSDIFLSELGEYRDLKLTNHLLKDDMMYEYKGQRGFAGTLAQRESEFSGSMLGTNKAHPDMLIRVLIALHRYADGADESFRLIVGQPIINHTAAFKTVMKDMLIKSHLFVLNGTPKRLNIESVEIAAEGASAYWSNPKTGKIRIIDAGSGTVNIATNVDGMYIDKESTTLPFGLRTNISNDLDAFSRRVAINCLKKWNKNDRVYLVGGNAEGLLEPMRYHFPNVSTLEPTITTDNTQKSISPVYANAVAFYNIGKKVYEDVV